MKVAVQTRKKEKGSAMVETALVLLTLVSMIIFVMDIGRVLLMQQFISERTRTTARNAVVNNWSATAAKNYLVYNSTTAPADGGPGLMGLLTSQVAYQTLGTAGQPDYRVQVRVTGVPALIWIPRMAGSYTLAPITATAAAESLGATN